MHPLSPLCLIYFCVTLLLYLHLITKQKAMTAQDIKRLYRSRTDKVLGGVCSGLANYFVLDPVLIRVAWVIAFFAGGFGLLAYLIAWIVIPQEPA